MTKYRLTRFRYYAWQLEELVYIKKHDKYEWRAIRYPGTIDYAAKAMVDLGFGDFTTDSLQKLLDKLDGIEQKLLETLRASDCVEFEVDDD
jgi:hypothetical protein